ncbi:prophage endopeptidase tail family protein [Priestia aryabhattai]
MPDMFVWSLDKTKKERLVGYKNIVRKWKVNNLNSISFSIERTELNKRAFDLMEEKSWVEYDGTTYTIEDMDPSIFGDTQTVDITAEHVFYDEFMNRTYVYTTLSTSKKSLNEYMSFIIPDTGYKFSIIGSFETKEIENFGGGNPLELFKSLLEKFEAEFEIVGNDIRLYNRIGSQTAYPYRSKHNISDITKNGSARNLSTYIKGFGKEHQEKDMLTGETRNMTSFDPNAWFDKTEPYYGTTLGATFKMEYYGTGVRFNYYAAPDGGIIEFTLDNDPEKKATVSCWDSTGVVRSVDLFRDAEQKAHTIYGVFKGKDPDHEPTLNGLDAPRAYVLYRSGSGQKTYDIYKTREGDEKYMAIAEYTSPLASKYGIRVQAPIFDERFTNVDYLTSYLRENLNDKLEISHEMTFVELQKAGYPSPKPRIGDSVPYIVEELDITIPEVRIMEIDEYPEDFKSSTIVLGNGRDDFGEAVFNSGKQQLDEIYDSRKKTMIIDVLPPAVKLATDALNNSLTQLEYPVNGGIIARDPNDYNRFVVLRSSGLGVTTNGGLTFDEAITALGINTSLLTAGQIKTNNIQIVGKDNLFYWDGNELIAIDPNDPNKFARMRAGEFYIKGGAFVLERPDGGKVIDNGIIQYGYAIQGMTPQFCSPEVTVAPRSCYTNATDAKDFQAYEFKHDGRYLRVRTSQYQSGSGTCYMSVEQSYEGFDGWKRWALLSSTVSAENASSDDTERETLIDFGVPTFTRKRIYIRLWSSNASVTAYGRVTGIWQEG